MFCQDESLRGRPRCGNGATSLGSRPFRRNASRSATSIWALRLRKSSSAHLANASCTLGSSRTSTARRSFLGCRDGLSDGSGAMASYIGCWRSQPGWCRVPSTTPPTSSKPWPPCVHRRARRSRHFPVAPVPFEPCQQRHRRSSRGLR